MTLPRVSRRSFLGAGAAASLLPLYTRLAAAEKKQFKIRDLRTMTLQGPSRTYVLVKVVADDGLFGMAEAYGTPADRRQRTDSLDEAGVDRQGPAGNRRPLHPSGRSTLKTSAGPGRTVRRTT